MRWLQAYLIVLFVAVGGFLMLLQLSDLRATSHCAEDICYPEVQDLNSGFLL